MLESAGVKLLDLLSDVEGTRFIGDPAVEVSSLSYRSDRVGPGHLFFCVPGMVRDGHEFASDAVERGAAALCVERELDLPVPQALVPSVRWAMGPVAAVLHGHPSRRLTTIGITGTNGKTTTAYLTAFLLGRQGRPAGLLGTVERRIGGRSVPADRTTPEAPDIQRDLAGMLAGGDQAAVLEVSSHALALGRPAGIRFSAVAFTNLTQDHLDFHADLADYFAAKSSLFVDPRFSDERVPAIVNIDDAFGRQLARRIPPERLFTYSADGADADLRAVGLVADGVGSRSTLVLSERAQRLTAAIGGRSAGPASSRGTTARGVGRPHPLALQVPLVGHYNVANALCALGLGLVAGLDLAAMLASLPDFAGVPGRLEKIDRGQDFAVLVDYAHTPDSVENVLRAARQVIAGRLIAVLGCGGDRDRAKRPLMGAAAERGADLVVITSDNPRSERPEDILRDILAGLEHPESAVVEVDRRAAISTALAAARPGDAVLVLGKGHERGQEFAHGTLPFDDREVAAELLAGLDRVRE
jgi:UDP-N-acetylmuramoyl-L-alanyl-D-glutamate--2,6-diaminopimelate ligase